MKSNSRDPLDWSVDEVVNFLCRNPDTPWSNSSSNRPDAASLEASLREHYITGEVLLEHVEKEALRDDLGLKALGHRSSVMKAISHLRKRSAKFQAEKVEQSSTMPSPAQLPLQHIVRTPRAYYSPVQPNQPVHDTSPMASTGSSSPLVNKPISTTAISDAPNVGNAFHNMDVLVPDGSEAGLPDSFDEMQSACFRPHEQTVVNESGRKRRRLNLGSYVESLSEQPAPKQPSDSETKHWYMGPNGLTSEQVFYSSDPEEADQTFTLVSSRLPTAQRAFVNNSLKYFFQQSPIELTSDQGSPQQAVVPYKGSLSKSGKDRFFTLYAAKQGKIGASKENINDWPQLSRQMKTFGGAKSIDESSNESVKLSDPFAYLLEKYPVENVENGFPLYGDSGSEGEFDEETWREMEEERNDPTPQQKTLGPAEIDSVITDCITEFEKIWREFHLPKEEYKARKLWIVAKRSKSANQQIKDISKDISSLTVRLEKLKNEICKNEYSGEADLRTQCQCLEQTVFNIQKQKWRIAVLERNDCPPKVSPPPKLQHTSKPKIGEEESLGSESDFSDNGSLDDFIIDDENSLEALPGETLPASPDSSSDGDDDIISVSGTRRRTRGRIPRVFESSSPSPSASPALRLPLHEKPDVIDLTMETPEPEDLMIQTPPLNPVAAAPNEPDSTLLRTGTSISPPSSLDGNNVQVKVEKGPDLPDFDDMEGLLSLDWGLIEERRDNGRLLAKLLAGLSEKERTEMADKIPTYQFSKLKRYARKALKSLIKGRKDVLEMEAPESRLIMRTATFYVSWLHCVRPARSAIKKKSVEAALKKIEERRFDAYYDELIERLAQCHLWKGNSQSTNHIVESEKSEEPEEPEEPENASDIDSEPVRPGDTPHKKRKREVKESQSAKENQADARLRVEEQEKNRMKLLERFQSMGVRNDNPSRQVVSFKEPAIYLNSAIGQRIKPHQRSGIQFMWRELIEDKKHEGCLLAHTMGLGKTMQVISLLTTITEATNSPDPKVRNQIPESLRQPQTLILCPPSLIENWHDEFCMWSPGLSRMVTRVTSTDDRETRLDKMSAWYGQGGILLIGYNLFATLILNKETKKRDKPLLDDEHENVKRWLLEGPNIIIADEAHTMKNPKTATNQAAMQFRSRSRIALTGSPLANNLEDYYFMVNWIAEDFLGDIVQFRAHYVEPIEQGLYMESTYRERRKSLTKLQVLKQILEPKVHRADISVLAKDLPRKVEFLLTVPLTKLQKTSYDAYAALVLQGQSGEIAQTTLWTWLSILGLCCNHPFCFQEKLKKLIAEQQDAAKKASSAAKRSSDADHIGLDLDNEPIDAAGLPNLETLVSEQSGLFAQVSDMMALELSARVEIAYKIIDESIKAGDKILVFSRSIPTLNYLEHVLQVANRKYLRLDGSTPVASRQAATKQFNQGKKQVYLISTRAGGLGLNIPGANRVIIFDFSFSPVWEEQAIGRAYRLGQQKPVFVYRFLAGGTFEEIIHHKAIFKSQLAVRVVDRKNPVREAQRKPGDYLYPAKPVPQQDLSEYVGKDEDVLDKILDGDAERGADRLIRAIKLTETFQADDNDKLTEDEKRSVEEEMNIEKLRLTDPATYAIKKREREAKEYQEQYDQLQQLRQHHPAHQPSAQFPVSVAHGHRAYNPRPPAATPVLGTFTISRQPMQQSVPSSAHNSGPPALAPDMIPRGPTSNPNQGAMSISHRKSPIVISENEEPNGQAQPNLGRNTPSAQQPAASSIPTRPLPAEKRPPGPQHTQSAPLNDANRLRASSDGVESEPQKPNPPIVDAAKPKTANQHELSSKSVPPQLPPQLDGQLDGPVPPTTGPEHRDPSIDSSSSFDEDKGAEKARSGCKPQ